MTADTVIVVIFILSLLTAVIVKGISKKTAYADLAIGIGGVIMALALYLSDSKLAPAWIVALMSWIVIGYAWRDLKKSDQARKKPRKGERK
ncbi:hypothetical protein [Streptomyces dysideae]|uniref:hypothetical protein n=1 Tax=Streptomyces dysideae TaxID=909626 RepID=UPI000A78834C|nr:hypothetical protein [Streptomyces dysideae]